MQPYCEFELEFIDISLPKRYLKPFEYCLKTWKTLSLLFSFKPAVIWVQLPPTFLLHILFVYKYLFNRNCLIVADCHNATFRKPWVKVPGFRLLLERCDFVFVHNSTVEQQIQQLFKLSNAQLHTLEDPPAAIKCDSKDSASIPFSRPWFICPSSFNKDEPVAAILSAASLAPQLTFVLTGNKQRAMANHDISALPKNVKLPGFLPTEEFNQLLCEADAIMGLTLLDGIQLSVANEAVGANQPLVLANTNTLRKLFYKGAVYIDANDAHSIASGCLEAVARNKQLREEIAELRRERQAMWLKQFQLVKEPLEIMLKRRQRHFEL